LHYKPSFYFAKSFIVFIIFVFQLTFKREFRVNKIRLNVLGISYSQTQSGAYALVLSEENGQRRVPIIVGGFEAQAIAIQLEGLKPPRPLTHDLFVNFALSFKINFIEVNIYKLEEGVFFSKLICDNGQTRISIDARTSDAIALALRFKCPIYTTEDILTRAGIVIDFENETRTKKIETEELKTEVPVTENEELKELGMEELKDLLDEAIGKENYERASIIRDEINRRTK
jgi:bifunctional DNase/RNase